MGKLFFKAGEIIFKQGDRSDFAYNILKGKVEILKQLPSQQIFIALLKENEVFGEMGVVDEKPRSLTARAYEDVELETVNYNEFVDLLLYSPKDSLKYIRTLFERIRIMNARFQQTFVQEIYEKRNEQLQNDNSNNEKPNNVQSYSEKPSLQLHILPLSNQSRKTILDEGIKISKFPFRIGRSSEHHEENPLDYNDIYFDDVKPYSVSRNHLLIEKDQDNLIVKDRGSYLGTIVNGRKLGGHHKTTEYPLSLGKNEIILGKKNSNFKISAIVEQVKD